VKNLLWIHLTAERLPVVDGKMFEELDILVKMNDLIQRDVKVK
jgi:hypothetical protein